MSSMWGGNAPLSKKWISFPNIALKYAQEKIILNGFSDTVYVSVITINSESTQISDILQSARECCTMLTHVLWRISRGIASRQGFLKRKDLFPLRWSSQTRARPPRADATYLGGAHDPPLIFAPVHAENLVPMAFEGPPGLHDKLPQSFHPLGHLVH